jgi:hypothetical protein
MTFWRTTLNLSINNTKLKSEPIQIKREIYQGDSLTPLWFCLAINPLTNLFKNLKILDLENTLVVEIQKGILLYSCHIVRKFLNIDTEHKTQKSQNAEARRR